MDLLERARAEGTPLIDGDKAIFVWHGDQPPLLSGDFAVGDWRSTPLEFEHAGTNLWSRAVSFPRDAYVEYGLFSSLEPERRVLDPFNRRRVWNGMGQYNHWFTMPDYRRSPFVRAGRRFQRGLVTRHWLPNQGLFVGRRRLVYLYQPPVDAVVPLVVVWDGPDYLRRAKLTTIVDNLIAQQRIRPIALALIDNGGKARFIEYMANDVTLAFVLEQVLPLARAHLRLIDIDEQPGSHGVLGASMGGLMALYAGFRLPNIFGHVISQSGAFQFDYGGNEMPIFTMVRHTERAPLTIWQNCGLLEWLLYGNRRMHQALRESGRSVTYYEFSAGHNYRAWSDCVHRGLINAFGLKWDETGEQPPT